MKIYLVTLLLMAGACSRLDAEGNTSYREPANTGLQLSAAGAAGPVTMPRLGASGRPLGVEECYSAESMAHPATRAFWSAMLSGDYAQRDSVIQQLTAAEADHPEQEQFAFLLAHASLWRAAEAQSLSDFALALDSVQTAEREYARAYELCPSDHRITAWLGPLKIMLGRALDDAKRVEDGERLLQEGVARYPLFVTFSNALAHSGALPGEPGFEILKQTAAYYLEYFDARQDSYCNRTHELPCLNTAVSPHNVEGTVLYVGDLFTKVQDKEHALRAYRSIDLLADAKSWRFRSLIDERIANLDANLAALSNLTELDDPALAWSTNNQCSYCHRN